MTDVLPLGDAVRGGPARRPGRHRREGASVWLAPVDPADADPLWLAANDGSVEAVAMWTYLPYGPFASPDDLRRRFVEVSTSDDPLFLTVHAALGPVGIVSFMSIDEAMRRIELGHIWYAPSAQRTETNTESVFLLLREAFEELGYRRVEWKCDALNSRSRAAAIRLGFTFEGVFRKHMIVKGRNRDTAWFAMVDDEWPLAKAAFERWLAAAPDERLSLAALRERS